MPKSTKDTADHILPLNMNGLSGRMLRIPSQSKKRNREILFIPGQHTSAERIYGLCEYLSRFGNVTSPDLPGFGGMDPFYKIQKKPTLDNMADYLAAFIKLRYRNRRVTVIAVSYGFAVTTRMLQRYPELVKKIDLLVSISGIISKNDFRWKKRSIFVSKNGSRVLSRRIPGFLATKLVLRGPIIRGLYKVVEDTHPKLRDADPADRQERVDFEIILWKINDFRTWMATCVTMFTLDLTGMPVNLPVYHVAVDNDHYFNTSVIEEHMRAIYSDFTLVKGHGQAHVPTVISTAKEAGIFIPPILRRILNQKS